MNTDPTTFILFGIAAVAVVAYVYWQRSEFRESLTSQRAELDEREAAMKRRLYELAILKELGDRVGYSLDVHQIIGIITGSLHQFIEYSAVSYMLIEPEKVLFNVHLETSVNRAFVDEVRGRMIKSLEALLNRSFGEVRIDEALSGAILVDDVEAPVKSFFNIPIVITERVVGVLTVAHTKEGLYKEDEMTILYKITNQASQAVTRLQQVVNRERSKLNALVESMADGVVMTDLEFRIVVVNPAAKKVIGLPDKKEITIFDLIDDLGGKFDIRGRLEESVSLNKPFTSNRILVGGKFYEIFVLPVQGGDGSTLGGVVVFHDITKEIEIEHMREDFTSMIVHELRSPLTGIQKIGELLLRDGEKKKPKDLTEYFQMIYKNTSSMLELVNDMLDVAKLEKGKFDIRPEPADIRSVVNNRAEFFSISARDGEVTLDAAFDDTLPDLFSFDVEGIKQVLNNLISNSLKFTKKGGSIRILAVRHVARANINEEIKNMGEKTTLPIPKDTFAKVDDAIVVAVTDTGVGIPQDRIGDLFDRFKQLDVSKALPGKKGTGLGLAISRGIVNEHGGFIDVVSKEGVGSTFYFVLPLSKIKQSNTHIHEEKNTNN